MYPIPPEFATSTLAERIQAVAATGAARAIETRSILSALDRDEFGDNGFGLGYNMNLYRGCQHGCIYCDSRSECYQLGDLSDLRIKANAGELLRRELSHKRIRRTIGTGSMNDPYQPVEERLGLTRSALEIIRDFRFPVHVITKSDLVVRDIDLLQAIGRVYSAVSITITTPHDELSRELEPGAPPSSHRFAALRALSAAGIYCGVFLMPILPWLTDTPGDLTALIARAAEAGAQYVVISSLSQRQGQREYFHSRLDRLLPGLRSRYEATFGDRYICPSPGHDEIYPLISRLCQAHGLTENLRHYLPERLRQSDWTELV